MPNFVFGFVLLSVFVFVSVFVFLSTMIRRRAAQALYVKNVLCWSRMRMRPSMAREERRKRRRSQSRLDAQKVAGCSPVMICTCFALVALSLIGAVFILFLVTCNQDDTSMGR